MATVENNADHRLDVLVVDDDVDIRETLQGILEREGLSVACAGDGREALAMLRSETHPRLILLDLMMPVMNGWEFRTQQVEDPELAHIPVAVISVSDNIGSMGPLAGFIKKPIRLANLLSLVSRLTEQRPA